MKKIVACLFILVCFLLQGLAQQSSDYKALSDFYHSRRQIKLAKKLLKEFKEGAEAKKEAEEAADKKAGADKRDESLVKDIPYGKFEAWNQYDKRKAARSGIATIFDSIIEIGPKREVGGRTRSILYDMANPRRVFAGAVSGGLWVSKDAGNTWNPVDDDAANLSVTSITQNPFDPKVIYYATGEKASTVGNGIYKSIDSGQTFQVLPSSLGIQDFKYTWKIEHSLVDSNTVFVSTNNGKLYRTQDGGNSWQKVFDGNQVTDILVLPDGSILIACTAAGIYKSSTGNPGTFSKINSPAFPSTFNIIELANCYTKPNIIYAAIGSQNYNDDLLAFCKSTDGGNTWTALSVPTIIGTQGDYNLMLGVHPTNPDLVICGGVLTSFSTTGGTGGIPWIPTPLTHSDEHAYAFNPLNGNEFLIGNDGGIWRFNWNSILGPTAQNTGYRVTQFNGGSHEASGYGCLGGTQDNGTQKLNVNYNKIQVTFADGGYCHISQTNPNIAYITQQYGYLHRSDNYASGVPLYTLITPPQAANEGTRFYNIYQMNYADDRQLYYRTNTGVWRTKNRGSNWERMGSTGNFYTYWLECSKEYDPVLYQFGDTLNSLHFGLFRYDNALTDSVRTLVGYAIDNNICGGSSSCSFSDIEIHPYNNSTVLLCKGVFDTFPKIFKVEKAETTTPIFSNISGDLPNDLPVNAVAFDAFDPDHTLYAGTENGFYYSTNGGQNWTKESDIPNVMVEDLRMRSDGVLFVYTYGRGMWAVKVKSSPKQYAVLPYNADYENGGIDVYTSLLRSNVNGRIKVSPTHGPQGNYSLQLNASSTDKAVTLRGDIRLNLTGRQDVYVKFDQQLFESPTANCGIYISDNGGTSFKKAYAFKNSAPGNWLTDSFNLSRAIDSLHLSASATFVLRFQDSTQAELPDGGILFDNISVQENARATGLHNALAELVSVFPNPANVALEIRGLNRLKGEVSLELIDGTGKTVLTEKALGKDEMTLDISALPAAAYVLQVSSAEGSFNKNIIKQQAP